MCGGVEQLSVVEQNAAIRRAHEAGAAAGRAVENDHRVVHLAVGFFAWMPEGGVVDLEFGQRLAVAEAEVLHYEIALGDAGAGPASLGGALRRREGDDDREGDDGGTVHDGSPQWASVL